MNNTIIDDKLSSFIQLNLNLLKNEISKINIDKVIDCITIFSENESNYNEFNELLSKSGKIVDKMSSGNLYYLNESIKTLYGDLSFIKVRKHDDNYNDYRISVDFIVDDYESFKNKLANPTIKEYNTFELIQFKNDNSIINIISLSAKEDYKL